MKYFILMGFLTVSVLCSAQTDTIQPPFKRFPVLPPLQILLSDSVTLFTKAQLPEKTPVLYMLFDPGCSHCQHETEELVAHKEDLKGVQIVMVTMPRTSFAEIAGFMKNYRVNELKNIVVGKDIYYFMPSFYTIRNFPYLALYNKEGRLIATFEGSMDVSKAVEIFKEND
jgi:thioredoxin-related protein